MDLGDKIKVTIPQLGDKKHLVDLSERNAKYFRIERFKQMQIVDPDRHTNRLMTQMSPIFAYTKNRDILSVLTTLTYKALTRWLPAWCFAMGNPTKKTTATTTLKR